MTECATCAHADAHGWWGPDHKGTHCHRCHRSWTAKRQEHCTECHEHFAGAQVGDLHRPGHSCLTPEEMLDAEFKSGRRFWQDDQGVWHWGDPDSQNPHSGLSGEQRQPRTQEVAS